MTTTDLFGPKPRRAPRVLMHVVDAGDGGDGKPMCRMECRRCKATTDWLVFDTVTEAKRGFPCETCNAESVALLSGQRPDIPA